VGSVSSRVDHNRGATSTRGEYGVARRGRSLRLVLETYIFYGFLVGIEIPQKFPGTIHNSEHIAFLMGDVIGIVVICANP
jgi:hypothetical protein